MDYKETLNLPKTSFPMKADLPKREPLFLDQWEKEKLYERLQEERKEAPPFILHDGPPYANGDIHIGHALNKILKDMIIRYYSMKGFRAPYVPGWDCHGLPVELQLFKELGKTQHNVDRLEFREKAREYAARFVKIQKDQFKRLGIWGDWERPYLTMNYDYQATIMECFWRLYREGYIYKGLKPVHWCYQCETALAEAEVEYENKKSSSIYVKFALTPETCQKLALPLGAQLVIWTTTPWTLPGNVAVALKKEADYAALKVGEEILILAVDLLPQLQALKQWEKIEVLKNIKGESFDRLECEHPFLSRKSLLILGEHVTLDQGTGCVHTAPGHGEEDYEMGLVYHLPILSPVNAKGQFTEEVEFLKGQFVFKANAAICDLLEERGRLILKNEIEHSYPHCWRCKSPVIFRATPQWFLGVDRKELRQKALEAIEKVQWVPSVGKNRISSMVERRPDWCLSRQRLWGVPIPIFYCAHCEKEFLDDATAQKVVEKVREKGASVWFEFSTEALMPMGQKCPSCGHGKFLKEEDIIDVWFDSGVSHHAVLKRFPGLQYPADLYLEGSDQHRGWFQTSLLAAMGLVGESPFKAVLTHGFVVDGEGKKMSKSAGNVVAPQDVMKDYGADILRLWVSSADFSQDLRISKEILAQVADTYRKIRNTFRYLLGNLFDYDKSAHQILREELGEMDRWALSQTSQMLKRVDEAYRQCEFYRIYHEAEQFCTVDLSSFYFDILKDRLYTSPPNSQERRGAQAVLYEIVKALTRVMAPILAFTAEEVWQTDGLLGAEASSVHLERWPEVHPDWYDARCEARWELIKEVRSEVLKVLESLRKEKMIGSALEAEAHLYVSRQEVFEALEFLGRDLKAIFIVSHATLEKVDSLLAGEESGMRGLKILVRRSQGEKCQRCWNYSTELGAHVTHPSLCERCVEAVETIIASK
ncbi:MAG: isoleucine--tRNA ligase [Chlamydiae bacterium]|nr:isoleucine--tRNA ligase [Chlamydiota bacterium]MBI3266122.1 isoleucine--tRNA ligase [Chlamydiota bacterium]